MRIKYIFLLAIAFFILPLAFSACIPAGSTACAEVTNIRITNLSDKDITSANAGDKIRFYLTVSKTGSSPVVVRPRIYGYHRRYPGQGNGVQFTTYLSGQYTIYYPPAVTLDDSNPSANFFYEGYIGSYVPPGDYAVYFYALNPNEQSYSNSYLTLYVDNPNPWESVDYVANSFALTPATVAAGSTYQATISIKNNNPNDPITGCISFKNNVTSDCKLYDSADVLLSNCPSWINSNHLYKQYTLDPGQTMAILAKDCKAVLGINYHIVNLINSHSQLMRIAWPTFQAAGSPVNVSFTGISSNKNYFLQNDPGTITFSTSAYYQGIPAGSKAVVTITDLSSNQVVYSGEEPLPDIPVSTSKALSHSFNYPGTNPLTYFKITITAKDPSGNTIPIIPVGSQKINYVIYDVYKDITCNITKNTCTASSATVGNCTANLSSTPHSSECTMTTYSGPGKITFTGGTKQEITNLLVSGSAPNCILTQGANTVTILESNINPSRKFQLSLYTSADGLSLAESFAVAVLGIFCLAILLIGK